MNAVPTNDLIYIILFPLAGALINLLFGRLAMKQAPKTWGRELVHLVGIGAIAISCFLSFSLVREVMVGQGVSRLTQSVYPWIESGETAVGFDLLLDHLSAVMVLVVTGVGLLIHVFSVGYMAHDPGYHRYFAYLNLFSASMLILVLGKSLVVTFVGWEGVGLCSYLLIGYWFTDDAKATAGRKAFIMNRVGDFGFILGLFLIYTVTSSLDVDAIRAACAGGAASAFVTTAVWGLPVATVATGFLFLGCAGKSAQIPLFTWLPDAMAGPTPVSALIHAATMVTAGVYLMVRLNFLFALAPLTMAIVAVIGGLTGLLAATIAITQNDIKKVLAYSTVSQLGFMFMAAGMGAWVAAIFHLMTHAFFKACLFLGSGAVIEACHHNQDIRTMGGLKEKMPVSALTFFVSCLAIAGIFPFAGFFSKDEILLHTYANASAWSPGINYVVWSLGTVAAACTSFYMFRLYYLTFEGRFRGDHHTWSHHVAEYSIMSLPLVILAIGATFAGFLGWPHAFNEVLGMHWPNVMHEWLEPVTSTAARFGGEYFVGLNYGWFNRDGHVTASAEFEFMGVSLVVAVGMWVVARRWYRNDRSERAKVWSERFGVLYQASLNKYWVDELYDALFVRPLRFVAHLCYRVFDALFIDGLGVGGSAGFVGWVGDRVRVLHNGNVRRYLMALLVGTGLVLATVYGNPTVSAVQPSAVHKSQGRPDLGGLRNNLGPQSVDMQPWWPLSWIVDEFHVGPGQGPPKPSPGPAPDPSQEGGPR